MVRVQGQDLSKKNSSLLSMHNESTGDGRSQLRRHRMSDDA